jgi:hypothetical protein
VSTKFLEWTDEELEAERERLIRAYPSVEYPLTVQVDADMTRLTEVQFEQFNRFRVTQEGLCIFTPYFPLMIFRSVESLMIDVKIPPKDKQP